jgi:RNA polymerase sigma factor (sigma-70 family)
MIELDRNEILAARQGSRAALSAIVRAAERPIYNLALRMLANRADAEDATQEILIRIVTNLGSLRDVDSAGAWAMRIATRHLVHERKRGRVEAMRLTFEGFAADLEQGLAPLPEGELTEVETAMAIEEVKIGCTLAMLVCLTRPLRIAYILGDVFELADTEAASVLEIAPSAYRQRLRRARAQVTAFVTARCGVVSGAAACRCEKRVAPALRLGRVVTGQTEFETADGSRHNVAELRERIGKLEHGRAATALMRSNPDFRSSVGHLVMAVLDDGR